MKTLIKTNYIPTNALFADYNVLRRAIDECESKYQDLMRIMYLFGVRVSELLPEKKGGDAIEGKDFSIVNIYGEDVLQLTIPTSWQAGKSRSVVVPLNPIYEEWSKSILDLSEERYNKKLQDIVSRTLQQHVYDSFRDLYWYENGYFQRKNDIKKYQRARTDSIETKHFKEIREVELILTHKFTPYEMINYFGLSGSMDEHSYFRKLLKRTDIYTNKDIEGSVNFHKYVFNPSDKPYNRNYMEIQKLIKKEQIQLLPVECINIDDQVIPAPKITGEIEHQILKRNIEMRLKDQGSNNITFENANFDVVDYTNKIAVECGQSKGSKLLDLKNNVYKDLPKMKELWILDYYDEDKISNLYKFKCHPKEP